MNPTQTFILELIKEGGKALKDNSTFILSLLAAFGAGVHTPQPKWMKKDPE